MATAVLDSGTVTFQAEGRLLQELGERLVARPEVALVELVKNAYDADSASCEVRIDPQRKVLVVADLGHGMTFDEFVERWMRIATSQKAEDRVSRTYGRRLTGAKGIGRFAVRFLGNELTLITVADDPSRSGRTKLTATFNWAAIDRVEDIKDAHVDYRLERAPGDVPPGTILEIGRLKSGAEFARKPSLRGDVLRIVSPLEALDRGRFGRAQRGLKSDPGFRVSLPGEEKEPGAEVDPAALVLKNYWARLTADLKGQTLSLGVHFSGQREPRTLEIKVRSKIAAGFVADIRFFPRRKGVFQEKGLDGRRAWQWVRDNHGVAVVDHGFRIVPYGYEFDDWLHLDLDRSHSERNWRSRIAQKHFPIPPELRARPAENPALYLPYNYQLVGAVFVESATHPSASRSEDLIPSTDREGFLKTSGFEELVEFVRAGVEFLALQDKRELDRRAVKQAREAAADTRESIKRAIEEVSQSPTLTQRDKAKIVRSYRQLADRIEEVEEYNRRARRNLTTMSLLGVVAGFMTHETKSIVFELQRSIELIRKLARRHRELKEVAIGLESRAAAFQNQLEYSQMFVDGVRANRKVRMSAGGQIRHVLRRFESFAADHGIAVGWDAPQVETPELAPAVYSGVLLNLYSNALKALLAVKASVVSPKIAVRAWNEKGNHFLEVSDNGVGIPHELRQRIWDPLYTTTSDSGNPLGSGMGLGLSLVKHVVEDNGGRVSLAEEPPPGFTTCFRVTFPLR